MSPDTFKLQQIQVILFWLGLIQQAKTACSQHNVVQIVRFREDLGIIAEPLHELHLYKALHTQEGNQGKDHKCKLPIWYKSNSEPTHNGPSILHN